MANTYEAIATVEVGSGGAASIDFTSIPSTYTDLCLKVSARTNRGGNPDQMTIQFNGSTSNYSQKTLEGYNGGTSSYSNTYTFAYVDASGATSNIFGNAEFYIPNYAGSSYKSFSIESAVENNSSAGGEFPAAGLWSDSAGITSIKLISQVGATFDQYSTATLYGIKNS